MLVKCDGRAYTFNIKTDSVIPDDMYQHPFRLQAGDWQTLRLTWPGFIRTRRGKELASQHQLDPSNIISYGISVVDKEEGAFELQMQWLRGFRLGRINARDSASAAAASAASSEQHDK
jgi:NADH dehydrogenase [ubiquinone] 1 alpha subcomplex assembly factor 1